MAVLEVIKYGHPTLRKRAEPCREDDVDKKLIDDMIETMKIEDGVGLAAPQVNVSKRIVVATDLEKIYVLINPEITAISEKTNTESEGCLSLPTLQAEVRRPDKIVVRGFDRDFKAIELKAEGLFARVLQHEIDHINGVLYVDRADLSTLVWLREQKGKDDLLRDPTTLKEVRDAFKRMYHKAAKKLTFEPEEKAKTAVS
jgi:peptide deformylase